MMDLIRPLQCSYFQLKRLDIRKGGELKVALKSEALISYYCPREVGPRRHRGMKPRLVIIEVDTHFGLRYHLGEVGLGCHKGVSLDWIGKKYS